MRSMGDLLSSLVSWRGARARRRAVFRSIGHSARWIASELSASGYNADFSFESLREVDRYIDDNTTDGEPRPDTLLALKPVPVALSLGSYLGEVIRRKTGGEWVASAAAVEDPFLLELHLEDGLIMWPMQRIGKRIRNGAVDSLPAYAQFTLEPRT
jgi:hypothetical protein